MSLYGIDQQECLELCLGMDEELDESLWVKIKLRAGTSDIIIWGSATGYLIVKTELIMAL